MDNKITWADVARIIQSSGSKVYHEYAEEGKLKKENRPTPTPPNTSR